jgi:hypothetical protein
MPLVTTFSVTLTNCDSNMYSHIVHTNLYKIVTIGKNILQNNLFVLKIGVNCLNFLHGLFSILL